MILSMACCLTAFSYNGMGLMALNDNSNGTRSPISEVPIYGLCEGGRIYRQYIGLLETRGQIVSVSKGTSTAEFWDPWFGEVFLGKHVTYFYTDSLGYEYNAYMYYSSLTDVAYGDFGACVDTR